MQRVDVEQGVKPVLIELEEADQHQRAGEQMGDVEIDPAHQKLPDTKRSSVAEQAEHQGGAEEFRHAEHPHLGDRSLEQREQEAADGELADIGGDADGERRHGRAGGRDAPGHEQAGDQRDIEQELERGGQARSAPDGGRNIPAPWPRAPW